MTEPTPVYRVYYGSGPDEVHVWHDIRQVPCAFLDIVERDHDGIAAEIEHEVTRRGEIYRQHAHGSPTTVGCDHR